MKEKTVKIKTSVFENFTKLTNENENVRITGAIQLIQQLEKSGEEKELNYAVKRLIRGNGSSTKRSRIGFYTALTGVMSSELENYPKISEILSHMKKEFKESDADKGRLDSTIGMALVCGAIIRSEKGLSQASTEEISEITNCLASCFAKPSVSPIAFNFLAELVPKVTSEVMSSSVWPQLSKHLNIAKDNITIDQLYLLLLIEEHHPETIDKKFMKKNWQSEKVLSSENFETFAQLLWKDDKATLINHPFYVYFMKQIVDLKLTREFWSGQVDNLLSEKVSKNVEMITINAAILVLKHTNDKPKELLKLLTPNFLKMINERGVKMERDEDFTELYKDFYELLDQQLQALKKSETKLQAFHTFTKISVEKSSAKKFISNLLNSLEVDELKKALNKMKEIIVSEADEKERQYVATVLQRTIASNKLVANDIEWRVEQQIFIANLAFLNSLNGSTIVKDGEANSIASVMKNLFYHSLESKMSKLEDEKSILIGIVEHLNSFVAKNDCVQKPLDKKYVDCWNKMYSEVTSNCVKKDKKLKLVFHVLMLHMALQLFNNPELAENAIAELEQVMDRAMAKKKKANENEPEWIEVVIDLFLTLLSQESSVLRNVIRHVFPQLCSQISVTAFNQILSMLDIRSKDNPLTIGDDDQDSDLEESDDDEMAETPNGNGSMESSDDDDISDDDDDSMMNEEEESFNDTVRLAVQNALQENMGDGDVDMDVDQISPEEGKRLNESLGNAFKLLMEHRNLAKKKKTKSAQLADKALLHFRMRVLDLVELYLRHNPQMEICLEILVFFYELMPFAYNQPNFYKRFEKIFTQLSQLKTFSLETVQNVTQKNLAEIFNRILEKLSQEKINVQQQPYFKCACTFMIYSSHILQNLTPEEDDEMLRIVLQHLRTYLNSRNPVLHFTTFTKILSSQWPGNFKLAKMIADEGLRPDIRALRRTQSIQMLLEFFKNSNIFRQHEKKSMKYYGKICEHILAYVNGLEEVSQSEFLELITFTMYVRNLKNFTIRDELVAAIQKFRSKLILKLNILNAYKSMCKVFNIEFVPNEKQADEKINTPNTEVKASSQEQNGLKRKRKGDGKKEKKLKKIRELEEASKGLDKNFSFV